MDYLSILTTAFGLIGFAGGAVGYFSKGRGDSIIAYQAKELDLRDETIKRLEKDLAACGQENKSLREQNATLVTLAQGSPQLVKLTGQIRRLASETAKIIKKQPLRRDDE